jgi:formylglycine-generating enzyme required for sulfatase activity
VWQWVLEPYNPTSRWGVMRGGSWATEKPAELSLTYRNVVDPAGREVIYGFRVVLDPGSEI